ncbi:FAD binding domain-containing protein [Mycena crocata]|nr:FAD binding domain-containing protein [Mycena crocata]
MPNPSILIAGAGPSGLVLALILLKNGVPVRIIDKERTHRIGSRGAGVMARTLELYATLGVVDDILKDAGELLPMAMYDVGQTVPKGEHRLMKYQEPTPDIPHANTATMNQAHHEKILRAHLAKLGGTVELGSELRSFEQSADSVVARIVKTAADGTQSEETATFDWLVGTDGAHSVVRKTLGLSFLGEAKVEDHYAAVGDIYIKAKSLDRNSWHMWNVGSKLIILRPDNVDPDLFTFIYGGCELPEDRTLTAKEFAEHFYAMTERHDIKFGEAQWMTNYRANIRMVDTMRQGRVFVAGDAAHCHTPSGAQGLNSSVQDAFNLGWKLALVHKHLASTSLLDTYAEERLRVIAHMLGLTTALAEKVMDDVGKKDFKLEHVDSTRMLGVNYSGSSIVFEEPGAAQASDAYAQTLQGHVQAAYRAPDAPGLVAAGTQDAVTRLFEVFNVSVHTVLVFGGDAKARKPVVDVLARIPVGTVRAVLVLGQGQALPSDGSSFAAVLEDRAGHAYKGYGADAAKLTVVVVRPDAVVGVVASDAERVEKYFEKILVVA